MRTTCYVGIDPGLSGGVAVIPASGYVEIYDPPTFEVECRRGKKGGHRREYDIAGMTQILKDVLALNWGPSLADCPVLVCLEVQQPMPSDSRFGKQGSIQTFSLGYGYGLWRGVVGALGIPCELVRPAAWKGPRGLLAGLPKEKEASRMRAIELFPGAAPLLSRKKDEGRAEALLIAEHVRRQHTSERPF